MSERSEATQESKGGWKQWTKARQILGAWKKSGLPPATFAREQGIGAERLRWWNKRLSESTPVKRKKPAVISGPPVELDRKWRCTSGFR